LEVDVPSFGWFSTGGNNRRTPGGVPQSASQTESQPASQSNAAGTGANRARRTIARGIQELFGWIDQRLSTSRLRNEEILLEASRSVLRAKRRSLTLLLRLLNEEQRQEFRMYRHFHVIGGSTGTVYCIRVASFANIDVIGPTGRPMCRLCAHPADDLPVYDVLAAQMLHLQDPSTERAFLRRANVHASVPQARLPPRSFWA